MKPNIIKSVALALGLCVTALGGMACSSDPEPVDAGGLDAAVAPDAPGFPDARADAMPGEMDADVDAGPGPEDSGQPDAMPGDAGPGPRLFSDFVKELINTQTNGTSSPVALPAPGTLRDTEDPTEYDELFP